MLYKWLLYFDDTWHKLAQNNPATDEKGYTERHKIKTHSLYYLEIEDITILTHRQYIFICNINILS